MGLSLRFGLNPKNLRRMCFENRLCLMLGLLRFTTLLQVPGAARPEVFPYGTVASRVLLAWQTFLHKGNKKMILPTPCECWLKRSAMLAVAIGLLMSTAACAEWQPYATSMAVSPRTGTDPSAKLADGSPTSTMATADWVDICQRHEVVQSALSSALEALDGRVYPCSAMTSSELAGLTSLFLRIGFGHAPLVASDFAGLTGLHRLELNYPLARSLPGDLLIGIPQIRELSLDLYLTELHYYEQEGPWLDYEKKLPITVRPVAYANLPPDLLTHSPQLRLLNIQVKGAIVPIILDPFELPSGLLAENPELRDFTIQHQFPILDMPLVLPTKFLDHNLLLESVTLQANRLGPWPEDFLAHNQRLQYLSIRAKSIAPWAPIPKLMPRTRRKCPLRSTRVSRMHSLSTCSQTSPYYSMLRSTSPSCGTCLPTFLPTCPGCSNSK